jgi:hypothetical protein
MRFVLMLAIVLSLVGVAYARDDRHIKAPSEIYQNKANYEYGAGLDVVLFEKQEGAKKVIPDAITLENKYDFGNQNGSSYLVVKYKLDDILKKAE